MTVKEISSVNIGGAIKAKTWFHPPVGEEELPGITLQIYVELL